MLNLFQFYLNCSVNIHPKNIQVGTRVFVFQIPQVGAMARIPNINSSKWRLSQWTSRYFLESYLVLVTYSNTLSKYGDVQLSFLQDMVIFKTQIQKYFLLDLPRFCFSHQCAKFDQKTNTNWNSCSKVYFDEYPF